jgi:ribonuclease P protein component
MISKENRLKEKQVKKVLQKWKPFFSYWIVLNHLKNRKKINRFAIIIWSKSVTNNVCRNYFRRLFYDFLKKSWFISNIKRNKNYDFIFVVKKKTKLDKKNKKTIISFEKDLDFLIKKCSCFN